MGRKKNIVTISGIVFPCKWDDHGKVTEVALETEDGEEYYLEPNQESLRLLAFVDQEIEAQGLVRERLDGTMTMSVTKFETLDSLISSDENNEDMPVDFERNLDDETEIDAVDCIDDEEDWE